MAIAPRKVMVLGSNSFTAAHFIDHLLERTDCEVVGLSRSPEYAAPFLPYAYRKPHPGRFRFHQLNAGTQLPEVLALCDRFRPEVVVNYIAQGEVRSSWSWPEQAWETNAMLVVRLAEALRSRDYLWRYVGASTPAVYGESGEAVRENHQYQPGTPYAASKLAGDLHLSVLFKRYGFPAVLTRVPNLYGIHQQLYRIIPRTVIYRKLGRKIELHGRGLTRRAFLHARDCAEGTWKAALLGRPGEVYHLAPRGEVRTMAEVVGLICRETGDDFGEAVRLTDENFGQDGLLSLDAEKARAELDWQPRVSFEEGVAGVIGWISDNWNFLSSQPLDYVHQT